MTTLFNRHARVTIGKAGEQGISFDQRFRIAFTVNQSVGSDANTMTVQVYNLSQNSRDRLVQDDLELVLEAGYEDSTEVLGISQVTLSIVKTDGPNIISHFECNDGVRTLRDTKINIAFKTKVSVQRVLSRIESQLGIGERSTGIEITGSYGNGFSFSGPARDALDTVADKANFIWSIQNGQLQLLPQFASIPGRGVLLTPDTGLIDSPEPLSDNEKTSERNRGAGFKVRSLLNPKIRPGQRCEIRSDRVSGTFRVDNLTHSGDNFGEDWITEAEVYEESG